MNGIPVIIPAYEPDFRLVELLKDIKNKSTLIDLVIIVDDGSGEDYTQVFKDAKAIIPDNCIILSHEENLGKGAALKTAFKYVVDNIPDDICGVVTADSDGQHTVECIQSVIKKLIENPSSLV